VLEIEFELARIRELLKKRPGPLASSIEIENFIFELERLREILYREMITKKLPYSKILEYRASLARLTTEINTETLRLRVAKLKETGIGLRAI
jgi:hypothetical protein